ncbi:hypothetical protein chiPu_0009373 [Chiloscyllium punctatum]|uniref:Dolichyl-diphosphooligosaccharide-protein glycosyltransferase subunit TMEM258 n=1 Tax=Chiloscyllium punctatum TaxID=137246 RepID=A0A401SKK6_CHIPU|nr:hypothetical protein [Chiloscyllium punctatum]
MVKKELEAMTRYTSPVNPAVFPHLTVVLLAIGMFFTAWFFVYEQLGVCAEEKRDHSSRRSRFHGDFSVVSYHWLSQNQFFKSD